MQLTNRYSQVFIGPGRVLIANELEVYSLKYKAQSVVYDPGPEISVDLIQFVQL